MGALWPVPIIAVLLLGGLIGWVLVLRQLLTLRSGQERLTYLAYRDALTGLENRARLIERLEGLLSVDQPSSRSALLYLDMDGFKPVNDSFGHGAGDAVLVEATSRLLEAAGPGLIVTRLGGDEFAIIVADIDSPQSAVAAAERLLETLARPYSIAGTDVVITASIGIALTMPGLTPEELVRNSDLAMYAAKARGRDTWAWYDPPMRAGIADTFGMEAELRRALNEVTSELEVAYQPFLDLQTDTLVAGEALARWSSGSAGVVGPSEFVPVAERTGLILELGRQVLTLACAAAVEWNDGGGPVSVWVNLSRAQVISPGFADQVAEVLASAGLDPALLVLEVTESAWNDIDSLIVPMTALRTLGVGLAIDDFGAGVSSLSCLWRVPVTAVKIDQSLIEGIGRVSSHESITEAIVRLGRDLGMTVAAEGIETAEQLDFLRGVGCQLAQGYFVAEPMPAGEVATLLRASAPWPTAQ